MRLDKAIADKGLAKSRESAKKLITRGLVLVNGKPVIKPSAEVNEKDDDISVVGELCRYVGRGGLKLEGALKAFDVDIKGYICADIGASTGGFTDCMLQNGAAFVYAVDVGHGQLDEKLLKDSRVANIEGVNARYITPDLFDKKPMLMTCDLSFISLRLVIDKLVPCLAEGGYIITLIKPQFEVGKANIGKNGIVKDKKVHISMLLELSCFFNSIGLNMRGFIHSPIKGGDGNIEYIALLESKANTAVKLDIIKNTVENAFLELK